jgi:hypothetical protein
MTTQVRRTATTGTPARLTPQQLYDLRMKTIKEGTSTTFIPGKITATPEQAKILEMIAGLEFSLYIADIRSQEGQHATAKVNYDAALKKFDDLQLKANSSMERIGNFGNVLRICYAYLNYVGENMQKRDGSNGGIIGQIEKDVLDGWSSLFS